MIPTPDLSHLRQDDYEHVYEPAEDTFALLDALEQDAEQLRAAKPFICLEIGSGSGCVSAFVGAILGRSHTLYLCTDINPRACRCTRATGRQNKVDLEPIITSLAEEEVGDAQAIADIQGSWAGGADGMQITDHFLESVGMLLSERGVFYLVAVKDNNVPGICQRMADSYALHGKVVLQRRAGREHLFILKFSR